MAAYPVRAGAHRDWIESDVEMFLLISSVYPPEKSAQEVMQTLGEGFPDKQKKGMRRFKAVRSGGYSSCASTAFVVA